MANITVRPSFRVYRDSKRSNLSRTYYQDSERVESLQHKSKVITTEYGIKVSYNAKSDTRTWHI